MISRGQALEAMTGERFDVAVIGGGITGAGVALDAATRGYSVALLERHDYASGTSSRSSKFVHAASEVLESVRSARSVAGTSIKCASKRPASGQKPS